MMNNARRSNLLLGRGEGLTMGNTGSETWKFAGTVDIGRHSEGTSVLLMSVLPAPAAQSTYSTVLSVSIDR